jgi:glutamate-1-semialdehyde 2,1-aminomutase
MTTAPVDAPALDDAVAEARARYVDRRPISARLHAEAAASLPGGNTRTVLFFGPYPFRVARGWDCHLEDVDGHVYVDLLGEYTAGLYGHSQPAIRAAIERTLADGISFGAHNTYEGRLAAEVCRRFPSLDLVRFTNSGTEANLMAVALARVVTGRAKIAVFDGGYHGGLMSYGHGGSPLNAPYDVVLGRYNDLDATARLFAEHGDELAAVLVEPMLGSGGCIPGDPAFLEALREGTRRTGALLVFDEVMTSRLAVGGAQERYGITPDLTTLGKYFGGGLSFGAFGGRRDLMARFDPTQPGALGHAGTFNNNVLSMAAGLAGLTEVLTPEAIAGVNARGDRLRAALNAVFAETAAPFCATGLGSLLVVHPTPGPVRSPDDADHADDRLRELVFFDLLDQGWYVARRGFIALSLAVTDDHVDGFVAAMRAVLARRAALWS